MPLQNVDETILYLNARNAEMEAVAAKYTLPPYNIKIMGNEKNYQIAQAMTWLIGNATNDYVLFLEKDFRLVESLDCVMEQLSSGLDMLKVRQRMTQRPLAEHPLVFLYCLSGIGDMTVRWVCMYQDGTAHVIKYRSRHNPGRPNWARILYMGHEDDVFKNQPNLLCNFYHWIDSPEVRWPEQFYPCGKTKAVDAGGDASKVFYCSKAFYCNWSNNPFVISKKWWHDEYVVNFDNYKVSEPARPCGSVGRGQSCPCR